MYAPPFWPIALAVFLLSAVLAKRSILGPQQMFARVAFLLLSLGVVLLTVGVDRSDVLVLAGAILALLALATMLVMVSMELYWRIDRFRSKGRGDRG